MTNLGNIKIEFGNAAWPQSLQLKSPKFYVPNQIAHARIEMMFFDIQIIKLENRINDIDPVLLLRDFDENQELVSFTLRNEDKQRLPEPHFYHEKCTKIHIRTGKWCMQQIIDTLPYPGSEEELLQLEKDIWNLPSSTLPMLCTTEYETIQGESGGPLVQKLSSGKWAVVGIVSGVLKDDAKPSKDFVISRFTSTVGYFDWIKSIIDQ